MKLCIKCKNCVKDEMNQTRCGIAKSNDPITGEPFLWFCDIERSNTNIGCGPEAKFFEPVNEPKESERG